MERPKCKLCSRTFANGRALGGHMKAHLATLPLPTKPLHRHLTADQSTSISSATHSSSPASSSRDSAEDENGDDKANSMYKLRENPRRSLKLSDPEFSSPNEAAALDGEESEAESTRRLGKRARGKPCSAGEGEEEAAIAMCLVMLSREKWTTAAAKSDVKRHRCEVCKKAFRSSQALGGHRVTHRKAMNVKEEAAEKKYHNQRRFVDDDNEGEKIFECPYCFKVFGSGQALGGHKRSHVLGSGNGLNGSPVNSSKARNHKQNGLIDLNLPAPPEEEDDRSVVSDGEITEAPGRI
ncbi:zinc finger protein ZAT1 [Punica granatum]|nr:zinc finger protein ZAT1 [Punica granatum]OWM86434.1 hypothetical protein CDL15_Pgr021521 [Punica granatum]